MKITQIRENGDTEALSVVNIDLLIEKMKRDTIVEFKGQWYAFYHNSALSNHDWLRSICVDKLYHNPDGTIKLVKQTKSTPITVQKKYPFRNPLTGGMNVCMVLDVLNIMSQYFRRQ